jgi:hypothetical protein
LRLGFISYSGKIPDRYAAVAHAETAGIDGLHQVEMEAGRAATLPSGQTTRNSVK